MIVFGESVQHIYFADLPRAVSFYTGLLGFSLADDPKPRLGLGVLDAMAVRRDQATLWLYAAEEGLTFHHSVVLHVSNVDGLFAELSTTGVTIDARPRRVDVDEYGSQIYGFKVWDPERNSLFFWQDCETPAEPADAEDRPREAR